MPQPSRRPIPVFFNPRAGGGEPGDPLAKALREAGVEADIRPIPPGGLAEALAEAAGEGAPVVAVCGGDGTLFTAANALAGSGTTLAAFPTGTLNHFARRLGLEDIACAARAIAGGETVSAPVGVMDDRLFLNTATFGLYADVVARRERMRRWIRKWPAAAVGFVQTLSRMRQMEISLEVDGERLTRRTPLVWVGVGWGSFPFVHESPDHRVRPQLEIVVLRPGGRLGVIALLLRMAVRLRNRKQLREDPALEFLNARAALIHARRPVGVTLDGEVLRCDSPIFVAIQEGALAVHAPGEAQEVERS